MVARPDDRIPAGDDDLLPPDDCPDDGALGEGDLLEGAIGDLRGFKGDEFEGLGFLVPKRRGGD